MIPWVIGAGIIGGLVYLFGSFKRKIFKIIESWAPSGDLSEAELRSDLAGLLRRKMPNAHILEEEGFDRSRVDISVGDYDESNEEYIEKVAIELKLKLRASNELNRLVGQLISYKQAGYDCVLVIAIDPEPNFEQLLNDRGKADGLSGFVTIFTIFSD